MGLPVLGWTLPTSVAGTLNTEYATAFIGHRVADIDLIVPVDRHRQYQAVRHHPSQTLPTSVLWRRLELLGPFERPDPGGEHVFQPADGLGGGFTFATLQSAVNLAVRLASRA